MVRHVPSQANAVCLVNAEKVFTERSRSARGLAETTWQATRIRLGDDSAESNAHRSSPPTEGLVDRLIELGKRFDYMAYPNRDHGLGEGRGTAVHLRMLMVRYLIEHLKPGPG